MVERDTFFGEAIAIGEPLRKITSEDDFQLRPEPRPVYGPWVERLSLDQPIIDLGAFDYSMLRSRAFDFHPVEKRYDSVASLVHMNPHQLWHTLSGLRG